MIRLPLSIFNAAAIACTAPAPGVSSVLTPAGVLRALDAIDGVTLSVGTTVAASVVLGPTIPAKIENVPFDVAVRAQARSIASQLHGQTSKHAHALRFAFRQHGVRGSMGGAETEVAATVVERLRVLIEEALSACTPPPSQTENILDESMVKHSMNPKERASLLRIVEESAESELKKVQTATAATATSARRRLVIQAALDVIAELARAVWRQHLVCDEWSESGAVISFRAASLELITAVFIVPGDSNGSMQQNEESIAHRVAPGSMVDGLDGRHLMNIRRQSSILVEEEPLMWMLLEEKALKQASCRRLHRQHYCHHHCYQYHSHHHYCYHHHYHHYR